MPEARTNTLEIRTPEGITFALPLAGPLTRFFAWAIDVACIGVATTTLSSMLLFLRILSPDLAMALTMLLYFGLTLGYSMAAEWFWRGRTLGKWFLKLRVVDEQGLRLQFSQVVIRNLLRCVDALPAFYLVGGVACLLSRRAQRIGDYAANTVVIRNRPRVEIDPAQIATDKYNSFRDYPQVEARLRQHVSSEEAALALQAILRREELEPRARVELFGALAAHFRTLAAFPEEASLGITDEQYIRNVVDSLYRNPVKERQAGSSR